MVGIGQKYLYLCKSDCSREKVVVIGQKWLYLGKVVVFAQKWLFFREKVVLVRQSDCI